MDTLSEQLADLEADMAKLTRHRTGEPALVQLGRIFQLRKALDDTKGAIARQRQPALRRTA